MAFEVENIGTFEVLTCKQMFIVAIYEMENWMPRKI